MTIDPRVTRVSWLIHERYMPKPTNPDAFIQAGATRFAAEKEARELIAAADATDPLRVALRNPSDELIERLSELWYHTTSEGHADVRAVLAALADEFGVKNDKE